MILKTHKKALLILIPIFITGLSLHFIGCHLFYTILSIMYYFENYNTFEESLAISNSYSKVLDKM